MTPGSDLDHALGGWTGVLATDGKPQPLNHDRSHRRNAIFDSASYRDLVEQGGTDPRIDLNDLGRSDKI